MIISLYPYITAERGNNKIRLKIKFTAFTSSRKIIKQELLFYYFILSSEKSSLSADVSRKIHVYLSELFLDSPQIFSKITTYSEEALRKLKKDDLIVTALNLQSKMESSNAKVLEKLKLLNDKFKKLETDVAITRNENSLLPSRLVDTERQCCANAQKLRRKTREIVGLPKFLRNDKAETKVCQIFCSLDCNVIKKICMLVIDLRTRSELL